MNRTSCLALASVLLLTAGASRAEKITFGRRFIPGHYRQKMVTVSDQTVTVNGQPIKQSMTQEAVADITISEPDAKGVKTMTWRYERFKMSMKAGGQTVEYDSAAAEPDGQGPESIFRALVGAEVVMQIGPDGKVFAAKGLDAVWDKAAGSAPATAAMAGVMKNTMGDRHVAQLVDQTYAQLPSGPADVGEEWKKTTELEVPMLGESSVASVCKLTEVKRTVHGQEAVIDYTARMVGEKPHTTTMPTGQATFSNVRINMTGRQTVNVANPILGASTIKQTGSMDMAFNAAGAATMSSRVSFEGTIKVTVEQAPPEAEKGQQDK